MNVHISRSPYIWILSCLLFGVFLTGYLLVHHEKSWRIPASSPGAVAFGPGYLPMEYTDFFGDRLWFRHVRNQTPMGIPELAIPQIVTLHVLTRNDEPPRTIQLQSDSHSIALPTQPQSWRIHLYVPANTQYTVSCDNRHVESTYQQQLCLAVVEITGSDSLMQPSWSYLLYVLLPSIWLLVIGGAAAVSGTPMALRYVVMMIASSMAILLIDAHALQLQMWRWGLMLSLTLTLAGMVLIWAIAPAKYRSISVIILLAVLIKILGFSVPGARFADLSIHIKQFENVLIGNLYQQMQGTISHDLIYQNQIQTYPYPPLAYLLIAPFFGVASNIFTIGQVIGVTAIAVEASLVVGVVWLSRRLRLSWGATTIAAATYVALPQSFILQNHTAAAQVIGQWASWIFMGVAVAAGAQPSIRQRWVLVVMAIITSAGHFGAFITMSVVQGFHVLIGTLRRAAWIWFGVVALMSVLYYSQFVTLILDQLQYVTRNTSITRWSEFMMILEMGVVDHYSAIIFGLGILAPFHPRFRRDSHIWSMWMAAFATFGLFTMLRVGFFVSPTRYVILLSPLIAIGMGSMSGGFLRQRAGKLMIFTLLGYEIMMAVQAWTTYKIDHQLIRWIVPQ